MLRLPKALSSECVAGSGFQVAFEGLSFCPFRKRKKAGPLSTEDVDERLKTLEVFKLADAGTTGRKRVLTALGGDSVLNGRGDFPVGERRSRQGRG